MKLAFVNLGCPKNQVDLETILGGLVNDFELTQAAADADAVVINTCAFIESAKVESIDTMLELATLKSINPDFKVIVTGCMPQRYRQELQKELPEVDYFIPSVDAQQTVNELRAYFNKPYIENPYRYLLTPPHYAYVQISQGCNNRCAYCAIPLIKGDFVSRPLTAIRDDVQQLTESGVKEVMLVAQDSTFYGRDLKQDITLSQVLETLNEINELKWVRLMYTHPAHWTDALMDTFVDLPKLLPYVDMPIQHIANPVLKKMGRIADKKKTVELIEKLRNRIPNLAIRTTVINGFPGETDNDHQELLTFLQDYPFERLGAFTYSSEEGTRAHTFPDQVPQGLALERQQQVMEQQVDISLECNEAQIGKQLTVLVDEIDFADKTAYARSVWDAPEIDNTVLLPADGVKEGEFYQVEIEQADVHDLTARLLK